MPRDVVVGPFLECDGSSCTWAAVAAALIDGVGYLYGLRREQRHWSVYCWRAVDPDGEPELVHSGAFARSYAEQRAREDAHDRGAA